MTTLMSDQVADARRMAYGSLAEQINLIETSASAGATTLALTLDVSGITAGTILSSGLNVWFVRSVNVGTNEVTVIPAYDNAPEAAVTAGDIVYIKAQVTGWYLFSTICDVIRSLSSPANGLYKVGSWTDDTDTSYQTYTIPSEANDMTGLLGARVLVPSSDDQWMDIPAKAMQWQPSQNTIRITRNLPSSTIEFRYKGQFTIPTSLDDDLLLDVGLTETMLDLPALGAVPSLLRTTESRRNQVGSQGDTRRPGEVPATANLSAANAFQRDFENRVGEEYARLLSRNPYRMDI